MIVKFAKRFLVFCVIMLIAQIITLILSFAMSMDGANHFGKQSNLLFGFLKNILGFPLYLSVDFDKLVNSKDFRPELIPLFIGNSLIQYTLIRFLIFMIKR